MTVIFVFSNCAQDIRSMSEDNPTEFEPVDSLSDIPEPTGLPKPTNTPLPQAYNPLTGIYVEDPQKLERRPVMIKVSNFPRAGRPHAGLSFADIVFDYYIGNGDNRFIALFYGNDSPKVGPVRSGRRVDAQLVTMYSAVLGYGGADGDTDAELVSVIGKYAVSHLEAPCPVFCGKDTHDATGVFADSQAFSQYVNASGMDNSRSDLPGMLFSAEHPKGAKKAEMVNILYNYYNRAQWRFDKESGLYLRWTDYKENIEEDPEALIPLVDRVTGKQLAFANVIIIFAEYTELAPTAHEINIWGNDQGLPAKLFRDGLLVEGSWKAKNDSDPMQFFNAEGKPFPLNPGNTWIVIAGLSSSFDEIQPGEWEMFFFLP